MFLRDSLLRVVSAFCIIWSEFSAYQNKHVINPAMEVSVFGFPFANWLYELTAGAVGWFLYPFPCKSAQVCSYSNTSQAPPLPSKPYFCPRLYKLICVAFLRLIFLLWFILEADTILLSISQNDPVFIFRLILPKPFGSPLNPPFLFPRGLSGLVLHQAICQLHYQFLSGTLARAAFDELDMWGRLLNVMFVNVPSVQITEMLTWFFCSWRVFISTAISHPAQEELASMTLFSLVKQMLWYLDPCSLFLLFQLFICYILKSI